MELKDKKILVVGLARTGVSVARFLAGQGAQVTVTDMQDHEALAPYLEKLADLPIDYQLGMHDKHTFLMADLIVVSPGVPMDIKPLMLARAQRRTIISEIELAAAHISRTDGRHYRHQRQDHDHDPYRRDLPGLRLCHLRRRKHRQPPDRSRYLGRARWSGSWWS